MSYDKAHMETLAIAFLTGQATKGEAIEYKQLFESSETFRNIVYEMGVWLAPLNDKIEDQNVPAGLLDGIMTEIDQLESSDQKHISDPVIPSNDNRVTFWKTASLVASLIAVVAVGSHFVTFNTDPDITPEPLMALLSDSSQPQLVAIVYNPDTGRVVARLSNVSIPDDGDLQLWLIRDGGEGPVSLGVMDRARVSDQIEIELPERLRSGTDVLAVSLESRGGSKTAGPEGPVLFTGSVASLGVSRQ